jgi:two-component system, NtrC family, sensor histidine kinase KinB
MKLRTKLLLGYAGFILALGVLGAWSARTLSQLSAVSSLIISENYDSVVAAQDMKESLERQDSAALFELLGQHERAMRQAAEHRGRFDAAFQKAAANITEVGESSVIEAIRHGRDEYYRRYDEFLGASRDRTGQYFRELEPQFNSVRAECDRLLHLNQEAMRRKANAASATARRSFVFSLGFAAVLMVVGVVVALGLSNAIVGPVQQVTDATTRVAAGDLDAAVPVKSADEIGALAVGFNRMAERIRELRRSDLGKLLLAQQTTEAAIDSLYDPVIVTDSDGRVTRINPAAERLFGPSTAAAGKPIVEVAPDARIAEAVGDVLQSERAFASESAASVLPWSVDGSRRAFRVRSTPMRDADDRLVGAVTLLEDITHLSEINRVKSEFIAAASHELRTPLTSLQMGIHLLLEGTLGTLDDRQRRILKVCREDAARLNRLMLELLDLSKIESGAVSPVREEVSPTTLIASAIDSLRLQIEARGIRLRVETSSNLPAVFADRNQVERVLVNLVTNAARATLTGGTITVTAIARGADVALSVADTGSGIPREYLSTIFEPFVQVPNAPPGGSGLGLTIARRIVEGHGGRLTVQSEPGRGSVFTFTIPVGQEPRSSDLKSRTPPAVTDREAHS